MHDPDLTPSLIVVADGDLDVMRILIRSGERYPLQMLGFHAQQAMERYAKAVLNYRGCLPPRTHDLGKLTELLQQEAIAYPEILDEMDFLTMFAVEYRYNFKLQLPGDFDPESILQAVEVVRNWALKETESCA